MSEEDLEFAREDSDNSSSSLQPHTPWKVLVVDDEPDIHQVTSFILREFSFDGRSLILLHADSAAEARKILQSHPDISCALIDISMETKRAGLELIAHIRDELNNHKVQIIVCTGHSDAAIEQEFTEKYDLHDFQSKTEVTRDRLLSTMTRALGANRVGGNAPGRDSPPVFDEEQAISRSTLLTQFCNGVRTPLSGMAGLAEQLLEGSLDDEQRRNVWTIYHSALALGNWIDDILTLTNVGADALLLEHAEFDLYELLDSLLQLFSPRAKLQGVDMQLEQADDLPRLIIGDPKRLQQILVNLIGNAVRFTKQGKIVIRAQVAETGGDKAVIQFTVADTGCGIDSKTLATLISPDGPAAISQGRNRGHSGLGLSTCNQLCQLMGGTFGLESKTGKGSRFQFTIPYQRAASTQQHDKLADTEPPHVLQVDDNRVNRMLYQAMLTKLGLNVDSAEHGAEALEWCKKQRYQLILMDCQMPVMDGYEATREIRKLKGYQATPIIALTGAATEQERSRCLESGMDDVLVKPLEIDQLKLLIERLGDASGQ